jgi:hypothetical protein
MKKLIITLTTICISTNANAENLIKGIWDKVKSSQNDLSGNHSNLSKVSVGPFYYYKLNRDKPPPPPTRTAPVTKAEYEYDHVAIAHALAEQTAKHPDVNKDQQDDRIDVNPELEELGHAAENNTKHALYGDGAPMRDDAVIAAWERADKAKKRLQQHREYMERVRKSRNQVADSKMITQADSNQISESQ